jgi:hypothetical protein
VSERDQATPTNPLSRMEYSLFIMEAIIMMFEELKELKEQRGVE